MLKRSILTVFSAALGVMLCAGCETMNWGQSDADRNDQSGVAQGSQQQRQQQDGESDRGWFGFGNNRDQNGGQLQQYTRDWPQVSQNAARQMEQKYGQPTVRSSHLLIWENKNPFKQIIVYREPVQHSFPIQHQDVLEHVIAFEVPEDKFDELAQFDGSIIAERTKGTLAARCDKEAANIAALNLAVDIINNRKTVQEARQAMADAVQQQMQGQSVALMQQLQFQPQQRAGDTDMAVIQGQPGEARPAAGQIPQQQNQQNRQQQNQQQYDQQQQQQRQQSP